MQTTDLFSIFIEKFHQANVDYMIVGSIAAIVYGEPRLTHDIDIVAQISERNLKMLEELFPSSEFYIPESETILTEIRREFRGHFNIIHFDTGFKADIYLYGKLQHSEFERKRTINFQDKTIYVAAPEDVIVKKLEFYKEGGSEKHIGDIAKMLNISRGKIDLKLIEDLCSKKNLSTEWQKALIEASKSS